jgi:hypothetical protein
VARRRDQTGRKIVKNEHQIRNAALYLDACNNGGEYDDGLAETYAASIARIALAWVLDEDVNATVPGFIDELTPSDLESVLFLPSGSLLTSPRALYDDD